jgi:hypothetical protein
MNSNRQHGMECSQFEALLADALDGTLTAEIEARFTAHKDSCGSCGPMFMEVREGMLSLNALPELEPPANLLHNILARTTMAEAKGEVAPRPATVGVGWLERLRVKLPSPLAGMLHARFATSFCMAFFSISLTMNLLGIRVTEIRHVDWHPTALKRSVVLEYTQVQARVQRYYDNMRLVLEVEAKVRQLKNMTAPGQENNNNNNNPKPDKQNRNTTPDTSGRPQEHENYSREMDDRSPQQARNLMPGNAHANPFAKLFTNDEGARI